jgi:hypothetical protein
LHREVDVTRSAVSRALQRGEESADAMSDAAQGTLFVAVVHAADGVRFTAAATSRHELIRQLTTYARRRAPHVLHADHARHFRALVARGELEGAVEVYFGLVGERWDKEWLVTTVTTAESRRDVSARLGAVAVGLVESA